MREIDKIQDKAVSWITGNCQTEYYQNLKILKLLPLSIYFELHDILFFHSLLSNQFDIQTNDYVDKFKGTRTRQESRGNFQVKDCRLKKTRENFWHRAVCLYNLFNKKVNIEEQTDESLKIKLTLYWDLDRNYNENNDCTWEILCFCSVETATQKQNSRNSRI